MRIIILQFYIAMKAVFLGALLQQIARVLRVEKLSKLSFVFRASSKKGLVVRP